jgi:hypothetical protein
MATKKPPIEDPTRIDAFTNAIAGLDWQASAYRASLDVVFKQLSELTQAELRYYYMRRCSSRRVSKACRFLAWFFGTAGILIPLLQPAIGESAPKSLLSWGYVAFGGAGAVLIFDNVFAGTRAHQRYTATQLDIEKIYTIFVLEWQARLLQLHSNSSPQSVLALLDRAIAFSTEFHRAMGAETSEWQETVNKSLTELKGKLNAGSSVSP